MIKVAPRTPKLRFPAFNGDWEEEIFGDIASIRSASRVHKNEWTEQGVPFFRTSDVVSHHKGTDNKKAYISSELFDELSAKSGKVKRHDLLVTGGGSIGVPYLVPNDAPLYFKDGDLLWFKISEQIHSYLLYTYFSTAIFRRYLTSVTHIGTIAHYTIEQAKDTPVTLPTLPEQTKIANFLTAVDGRIRQLTEKKSLLEDFKKGVMQQLFSQAIRFKDDHGNDFPDWEEKKLGEACSFIKDGTHGTHPDDDTSDYLLLSAKNIKNGKVTLDQTDRRISEKEYGSIYKNYALERGDILLTVVGTIGRVAIYKDEAKIAFQRSVAFLRFDEDSPNFMYQQFCHEFFQKALLRRQVTSAQPGIYLGDIAKISVFFPCADEQTKIANFLSAIDRKIESVATQITETQTFKRGLLQQMFV